MEQPSWATPSVGEWQTVSACTPTSLSAAARASLCATNAFDVGLHKCRLADWDSSKRFAIAGGAREAWPRGAHCCVGTAVVGVEDGTAVGARVGALVVGLRMRTSAGAVKGRSPRRCMQLSVSCVLSAARMIQRTHARAHLDVAAGVGVEVGDVVAAVGVDVGAGVGVSVGTGVGDVGVDVGVDVGAGVGADVGSGVGLRKRPIDFGGDSFARPFRRPEAARLAWNYGVCTDGPCMGPCGYRDQ